MLVALRAEQIHPVEFRRIVLRTREVKERRRHVHQRTDVLPDLMFHSRAAHHERDMAGGFHHAAFPERAEIPLQIPVIGGEQDQCILIHSLFPQSVQDTSDLIVHKGHAGVIIILKTKGILLADHQALHRMTVADKFPVILQIVRVGIIRGGRILAVEFVPGSRRTIRRMRVDKGGHQHHGFIGVALLDILDAAVRYPLRGMVLRRVRRDLRHIVHLAAHSMNVEHVRIALADIIHIIVLWIRQFLLRIPLFKTDIPIEIFQIMHLAHAAALPAQLRDPGKESLALVGHLAVVIVAAGTRRVLSGKHGQPGGHAYRRRRDAAVEHDRFSRQRVQIRRLHRRIPKSAYGVIALLIGKQDQNIFHL